MLYLSLITAPRQLECVITEEGIAVGGEFIPYKDIAKFWFVYEPPMVKKMYFELRSGIEQHRFVFLENQNPNAIRSILGRFAPEDLKTNEEPFADIISRLLKI